MLCEQEWDVINVPTYITDPLFRVGVNRTWHGLFNLFLINILEASMGSRVEKCRKWQKRARSGCRAVVTVSRPHWPTFATPLLCCTDATELLYLIFNFTCPLISASMRVTRSDTFPSLVFRKSARGTSTH